MATLSLKEASRYLEFGVLPVKDGSKTRQHSGVWRSKTDVPGSDNNGTALFSWKGSQHVLFVAFCLATATPPPQRQEFEEFEVSVPVKIDCGNAKPQGGFPIS